MADAASDFEFRLQARATLSLTPPYDPEFEVLPDIRLFEMLWELPEDAFPPGSRGLRFLDYCSSVKIEGVKVCLVSDSDAVLIDQFKELMVAIIHRPEALFDFIKEQFLKVKSVRNYFTCCRRLFCALKYVGVNSLENLTSEKFGVLSQVLSLNDHSDNAKAFRIAEHLARRCLISAHLPEDRYVIKKDMVAERSSPQNPADTLTFNQVADILKLSRFYVDNAEIIIDEIRKVYAGEQSSSNLLSWANRTFPIGRPLSAAWIDDQLLGMIQVSAFNMLGYHLGPRTSEGFSARRGFVGLHCEDNVLFPDRLTLKLTTWKEIEEVCGEERFFPVHPYMQRVQRALELVADCLGVENDDLFVGTQTLKIYNTSNFNHRLNLFCKSHALPFSMTSYTWRNTLPAITIQAAVGSLASIRELYDHASVNQSVAYGMKNPFIRPILISGVRKHVEEATDRLLSEVSAFGGKGLGGAQGQRIEMAANELVDANNRSKTDHPVRRQIASDFAQLGIAPIDVDKGIKCWRVKDVRGLCAHSENDAIPDIENCQPECTFRAETSEQRAAVSNKIQTMETFLSNEVPILEKIRWSTYLVLEVGNWPSLGDEFQKKLEANPELAVWFKK
ncbi:hypothetical protein [Agrobacterium cavarae]|uniref:hypothetical protein n=1 Tax=Agrobacterium cavarae TaxID=2528239 RepID=UPI0028AE2996|nr:hypothetical protein [Agrobacterium cavarae]